MTATADLIEAQKKYYRQMERAADLRAQAEEVESTAESALANKIAYVLDVQRVPLRQVWKALGWSNVKTKAWADRARKRNRNVVQARAESNKRPRCVKCGEYLPGEYPTAGIDKCWKCRKGAN